jgi:Putative auto-transporter adhesin, head GIN domain
MRNLLLFMFLVGIFMFSRKSNGCNFSFGGVKGEGPMKTENRDLSNFTGLSVECSGNVEIVASETYRIEISAQENIIALLTTEIKNNTLVLDFSKNISTKDDVRFKIFVPNLNEISLGGSANIVAFLPLTGDEFETSVGGSGNIEIKSAEFKKVTCTVSGSGNINITGKTDLIEASISGSGGVESLNLAAQNGDASVSGSGSVTCNVEQKLEASISGSGEIKYKGNATAETSVSGSGSVSKI